MEQSIFSNHLNFRQNDKKVKQRVINQNVLLVPKQLTRDFCQSYQSNSIADQKKKSITTNTSSKSNSKQGRLLLRDYLYLTNKNSSQRTKTLSSLTRSKDKKQIRKQKYKLDEQKIFYLMQDQMKVELNQVIQRLQKMKENFKDKSLKDDQKDTKQNIALIYSIKSIIKDKFKKGIQDINMILFQEQTRKLQLLQPENFLNKDVLRSENCFNNRLIRKKQHKISLQIQPNSNFKQNSIPINGAKFNTDFI